MRQQARAMIRREVARGQKPVRPPRRRALARPSLEPLPEQPAWRLPGRVGGWRSPPSGRGCRPGSRRPPVRERSAPGAQRASAGVSSRDDGAGARSCGRARPSAGPRGRGHGCTGVPAARAVRRFRGARGSPEEGRPLWRRDAARRRLTDTSSDPENPPETPNRDSIAKAMFSHGCTKRKRRNCEGHFDYRRQSKN